ncbi:hypothetical protein SLS62_010554 [Diatrype stigma]|uniref:Uncharacterized protein n=1 Tax=Diatrype stigma TaxID=117547 RepID=A0AAN9U9C7_9PEZI
MSPIAIYRLQPSVIQVARRIPARSFRTERPQGINEGPAFSPPPSGPNADVQPGDYVWAWCKEHDIALADRMKGLRVKQLDNRFKLSVFTSRQHCIDITHMRYFDKYEHPYARTMFDVYIAKKKATLWYKAWAGSSALPFVISTAERRIKRAIRLALESRGYDRDGRRMETADGRRTRAGADAVDLFGTLKIQTAEPKLVCNVKFAELQERIDKIMGMVEIELRRGT